MSQWNFDYDNGLFLYVPEIHAAVLWQKDL